MADFKVGYGKWSSIEGAVERGIVDDGDMIVTSDSNQIVFIAPDGRIISCKSQSPSFKTYDEVVRYAAYDPSAYDGEVVTAKAANGKLEPYILAADDSGSLQVQKAFEDNGLYWEEI